MPSEDATDRTERARPLNLTDEEVTYLWDLMKREVGREEVQYGPNRDTVESIHTKVRKLHYADGENDRSVDTGSGRSGGESDAE